MKPIGDKIWVTKNSGEHDYFKEEKLRNSLEKAKADKGEINRIISEIKKMIYPGIPTKEIYKKAFAMLRKSSRPTAARYRLKKAIMQLGPSGFPFEKYIAEILKYEGYKVQVGEIVKGHCVQHEIDVIAEKDNKHFMIECKFHSDSIRKCNVKIPLYIQSRFLDVEKQWKEKSGHTTKFHQGWVATNTRFTADAIQYGSCMGLYLLGWNYPKVGSLKERIDASGLHPITCLTTLTGKEKQRLLEQMTVLCKDLHQDENKLLEIGLSEARVKEVMKEAKALCEI